MKDQDRKAFIRDFIISFLLHLLILVLFIYGSPSFKKIPEESHVIVLEMLPVEDIVNVKNQSPQKSEEKDLKPAQKIKQSAPKTPKEKKQEPEKAEEKPKEVTKPKEPEIIKKEAEPLPEPKKEEKKQTVTEEKSQKKEKIKAEEQKKLPKKPKEDPLDSILKTLENESEGEVLKSKNRKNSSSENEGKTSKGDYNQDSPLSITEKLLIKQQIEKNWRPPVGSIDLENIQIILHLSVELDGTITEVKIKDMICPSGNKQICDLVAESSLRAAKQASPLTNLSPARYDYWKEFDLRFDPSQIMN